MPTTPKTTSPTTTLTPSTQPGRHSPKTGKLTSIVAALNPNTGRPRTPEERFWIAFFEALYQDAADDQVHADDFEFEDSCWMDFVAFALGWPTNTIPQLFLAAEEEKAKELRKEMHLV